MEESGLAICLGLSEVLINRAKFGVKPQLGSVGVVGSFLSAGPGPSGSYIKTTMEVSK